YYAATYGCLRLGELIQCRTGWLITPTDEVDRNKLKIRIYDFDIDYFLKSKNNQSKQMWKVKTFKKKKSEPFPKKVKFREVVIHNPRAIQSIKVFLNKHPLGLSECFPECNNQKSIDKAIQRKVSRWVKPLQAEHRKILEYDGLNRTAEEIKNIVEEQREKLTTHPLRATGINYLIDLGYSEFRISAMVGNTQGVREQSYNNNKDVEKVEINQHLI
ncbi:MAG: hypothetical protein HRU03_09440, partial [Nanoarchaeales archaeon]|nr:hypothetical protein [Nanoarchaeales archaeon]